MGRTDELKKFIEDKPEDPFPRFALAMELKGSGMLEEAAAAFAQLFERAPDYVPAFLQAGAVHSALGHSAEAATIYRLGIAVCTAKGQAHARSQIEAALADLGVVE